MSKKQNPVDEQPTQAQDRLSPVVRQAAQNVFGTHLNDELFFTSDHSCFTELYQAEAHAVSLENKDITTVKREEI
jgi:hypothetical protein